MFPKHNPNLATMKVETTDDAIKRGVEVQTSFLSKAEKKKFKDEKEVQTKYNAEQDLFSADHYKQLQAIKAMK